MPVKPQIFHGHAQEIHHVIDLLVKVKPARIAILGPGGMGKSSLALTVLHHEDVISKFGQNRYFIGCDTASSYPELLTLITSYFGLAIDKTSSKAIIRYFSSISEPSLMVLDNLETPWEPSGCRLQAENFLSLLTDIPHLHLVVSCIGF